MARVTVEDCVQVVNNRYELVLLAAQRARDIASGAAITVSRDNDKNPVVALREIADQSISLDDVRDHIVNGVNRMGDMNEEDDLLLALAGQSGGNLAEDSMVAGVNIEEIAFDGGATLAAAEEDMGDDMEMGPAGDEDSEGGSSEGFGEDMGDMSADMGDMGGDDQLA